MRLYIWSVATVVGVWYASAGDALGVAVAVAAMLSIAILRNDDE